LTDAKLAALQAFTLSIIDNKGWVSDADLESFQKAGYTKSHVMDVIVFVGIMTLSNYICHVTKMPLDEAFSQKKWESSMNS